MTSLTLPDGKGKISYQEDGWESGHFGKKVIKIQELEAETPEEKAKLIQALEEKEKPGMISMRISESDHQTRQALESQNYSLMETLITLTHNLQDIPPYQNTRSYEDQDLEAVKKISGKSFSSDRYHNDPLLKEHADALMEDWITNSCKERADIVLVSTQENEVTGFSACNIKDSLGVIDLIATDSAYRRQGIGRNLVHASLDFFKEKGLKEVHVSTQGTNVGAINLYEACGFKFFSAQLTYHKHF
jgi:dTDP-4-amino-4,6-dideoxy-D-galactose acyltransferase